MAKISHRVGYDLLDNDVKSLIDAGIKAFDVSYDYVLENTNPYEYVYVRIADGEHVNELYVWQDDTFKHIGEHPHTHTKAQITDFAHTHTKEQITDFVHTHTKGQIVDFAHNHDDLYYSKQITDDKLSLKADKELHIGITKPNDNNIWYKEL